MQYNELLTMLQEDFATRVPAYKARVKDRLADIVDRHRLVMTNRSGLLAPNRSGLLAPNRSGLLATNRSGLLATSSSGLAPGKLGEALIYVTATEGKRLRPLLSYAAAEWLEVPPQVADYPAVAVELIHTYSLIHDDLMDQDTLRRGRPTVHQEFDEPTAILLGDALQALAFEFLSHADMAPEIVVAWIKELAAGTGMPGMILGQAMDIEGESRSFELAELEAMHHKKSGALITASLVMPALATAGMSATTLDCLRRFGQHLGLAFQIRDDILDYEATTAQLGKPQGSDLRNHKSTFVSLVGLAESRSRMYTALAQAKAALATLGGGTEAMHWLAEYMVSRTH